jgi:PAS domain S-box-containing protein
MSMLEQNKNDCEALRASEARFRSLVETTSDWIWEVDENLRYTYAGPRVRELLGYEPDEILGLTPFELMPALEAERVRVAMAAIVPSGFSALENVNRHKQGHLVVLETSGQPILDAGGVFRGYRGIDRDVTARSQAEAAQARLVAIVEATSDFVSTADTSGNVLYVNRAGRRMLGLADDDALPLVISDAHPAWASAVIFGEGIPTSRREGVWRGQTTLLSRDGREIPVSQVIIAHRDRDGAVEYMSTICRDITDRQRVERLREEYLQAVSHDIRSPLSAAALHADMLGRAIEDGTRVADAKRHLRAIRKGMRVVSEMIETFVESARLENRELQLQRRAIELQTFIAEMLSSSAIMRGSERVDLAVPSDLPRVDADPELLQRILLNLLGNALKYSPRDSRVAIDARSDGSFVTVAITDQGPGIAAADLPHIFERFYRSPTVRADEGLGLGLHITKVMVEAHLGHLWVENTSSGGATFCFTLPAA